ncbi:hypothetical protein AMET1_0542 [Methanonatronarchaeum thermophilum]|uniref:Uncharacterized protein n=1 Tax=Methanonatronarchaeum thermophilum TaxID=1927129 RepID=A0A1Y3GBQ4_9EURY|nr:hypothetical protein [Methanonatronarchaeum thermophilum]OUJ18891.1 hypothetical protein AMET1_0542 [Methanonatronarchaeum thermophilum]
MKIFIRKTTERKKLEQKLIQKTYQTKNKPKKMEKEMKKEKQLQKTGNALQTLFKKDKFLLKEKTNERTITHKLASHLQKEFTNYNVDVEYNKMTENREQTTKKIKINKQTEEQENCWGEIKIDDTDAKTVYPDIIIHKRNTDTNLIVIEVKKSNNPNKKCDIAKLQAYKNDLEYTSCIFLKLKVGKEKEKNTDYIEEAIEIKKGKSEKCKEDITDRIKSKI